MNDFNEIERVRSDAAHDRGPDDDPDARVERLTTEIDETRGDLTQTIAEIGEKLDPSNLAREASATVRQATLGKVDQMTYGAQETWRDVRTGNTGSLVDTITSNPIPAGMVALGIGLLFMNRGAQGRSHGAYGGAGRAGAYRAVDRDDYGRGRTSWSPPEWDRRTGGDSPLDKVGSAVSGAGDRVGQVADQAGERVSGMMEGVGQTAEHIPHQAGYLVGQGTSQVRRFIDDNPLGAGVIALAAGAAIGMLLPTTPIERDTIGQARDQLVDKVEGTVHEALDKADEQAPAMGSSPA